jgi:Holliday junction resolvase
VEREFVALHRALGVAAHRVPLSGAVEGYKGDLRISVRDRVLTAEVKARAGGDGFKTLERWLAENHLLLLRRNHAAPMVLLPWEIWAWLIGGEHEETTQHDGDGHASQGG